jgi:hypothetical protein
LSRLRGLLRGLCSTALCDIALGGIQIIDSHDS